MFDILAYLVDAYRDLDACPPPDALMKRLSAAGFEEDEVRDALEWLQGLSSARHADVLAPQTGLRCYDADESAHLSAECRGLLHFLEKEGAIDAASRELVIDRLMALPVDEVTTSTTKLVVLTVLWSLCAEPDLLVFDMLLDTVDDDPTLQ